MTTRGVSGYGQMEVQHRDLMFNPLVVSSRVLGIIDQH
jgi:hypothetical protein